MTKIKISDLRELTGVGFGTSGIRDLNEKLTDKTIYTYTLAFLKYAQSLGDFDINNKVALAGDRRQSTDRIMKAVVRAITDFGVDYVNCGLIPTPAVSLYGIENLMPSIMVTGSHIPEDRNGVKFSLSRGEILKPDETEIAGMEVEIDDEIFDAEGRLTEASALKTEEKLGYDLYKERYLNFFGKDFLIGKKVGVYGHSAVGRELMVDIFNSMGAEVVRIEFAQDGVFVPVDTDAVDGELISKMHTWDGQYQLDYIVSTDGDGDRPLLSDENGNSVRAETVALLACKYLGVEAVACTITSSTAVDRSNFFKKVVKVKIGSPQVISAMNDLEKEGFGHVAGYELNGGLLIQTPITKNQKVLRKLPTRDALLAILATMALAKEAGQSVSSIVDALPKRYTYSSSIKGIPTELSLKIIDNWQINKEEIENIYGKITDINTLDGLRLTFENGNIVHFRPSKNSPEFRDYVESDSFDNAKVLSDRAIQLIKDWTGC